MKSSIDKMIDNDDKNFDWSSTVSDLAFKLRDLAMTVEGEGFYENSKDIIDDHFKGIRAGKKMYYRCKD
jgi:hypothetical protein